MKGERRHELQQNDLLVWVNNALEGVKPYATLITLLLLLAAVATAGWTFWDRQANQEATYAWEELFGAMNSGDRAAQASAVAEQCPGSDVAEWATVVSADTYLDSGCQQLFRSKATAVLELDKAVNQYREVLQTSRTDVIRERASYGLARAYEALAGTRQSGKELDEATKFYQEVATVWPDGTYAEAAGRRLEDLQRPQTLQFYDKFAQFDPKPAYTEMPDTGVEGPKFDLDSLDNMSLDGLYDQLGPGLDEPDAEESPDAGDPASPDTSLEITPPAEPSDGAADESPEPLSSDAPVE